MYNAPLGMLKTISVTDIAESSPEPCPVIHHATRQIIGNLCEVPPCAGIARGFVDRMMADAGVAATYISLAETRNGRRFVLAHD